MHQNLDHLLTNNDCPSDGALQEVKSLLSGPWKKREEIDAEIRRLENLLVGLKKEKEKVDQPINRYTCILSPIRRVPPDILRAIFEQCLPSHRNPTMGASECPMLLTRICSTWRTLAMSSPRLWSQIHIPYRLAWSIYSLSSKYGQSKFPSLSVDEISSILRLRCHAVKEWLSRSGDCPLSISICYAMSGADMTIQPRSDDTSTLLLETILHFSSRLREFEIIIPLSVFTLLEVMMLTQRVEFSNLVRLRASIGGGTDATQRPASALFSSPNLQHVSAQPPCYPMASHDEIFSPGQKITHLFIHSASTLFEVFLYLKTCPNLTHMAFYLQRTNESVEIPTVTMDRLTTLWITEMSRPSTSPLWANFYDFIHAPGLQHIKYTRTWKGNYEIYSYLPDFSPSILRVVERTLDATSLVIERSFIRPEFFDRILHSAALNNLVKLVLYSDTTQIFLESSSIRDPFDIDLFITQNGRNLDSTILPRLEVFELEKTRASDESIIQFITGRLGTWPHVATLRSVKLTIDRLKKKDDVDLYAIVQEHSQMANTHLDLIIEYPLLESTPLHAPPHSCLAVFTFSPV